jgi:hypothetical protein
MSNIKSDDSNMSKFYFVKIVYSICIILLFGCDKNPLEENINSDIQIVMKEILDSNSRKLQFICSTEDEYPCSNYTINNSIKFSDNEINIQFNEISTPDLCFTSIGPATAMIDMGKLEPGNYDLEIKVKNRRSSGKLVVTSNYYEIQMDKTRKLEIANYTLNRIPDNSIWGKVGYHYTSTEALVESFIDSLMILGATSNEYSTGDYGYFQIATNGQISFPGLSGYHFQKPFIFHFSQNSTLLKNLVRNYGQTFGDSVSISLFNTRGEVYRSWVQ